MAKKKTRKAHRDAETGRFVTRGYAKKHPKTTVTEIVPARPQRPPKKPPRPKKTE